MIVSSVLAAMLAVLGIVSAGVVPSSVVGGGPEIAYPHSVVGGGPEVIAPEVIPH
jgi:hypothetical protein